MLNHQNATIAIIDSGIGGVSILRQLINLHQAGNYIYFADNQFMPYGNKTTEWLCARIDHLIKLLQENYKVDKIIIACNTASTCIDKEKYDNVIIMQFDNDSTYYATNLTKKNLTNFNVIADKTLAKQIENNIFDLNKMDTIIKQHVKKHKLNTYNQFTLGCTHYELVKSIFEKYCPKSKVINNSSFVIDNIQIKSKVNELNLLVLLSKKDRKMEEKIYKLAKSKIL